MDNIIQKFYSNGKDRLSNYSQFGAFSTNQITNRNRLPSYLYQPDDNNKPILPKISTTISQINPHVNAMSPSNFNTISSQRYTNLKEESFLNPKPLVFNSTSDMMFSNYRLNPTGEFYLMKENLLTENKKNMMKIQMIEDKLKNLELKNKRLEVINDFFFFIF